MLKERRNKVLNLLSENSIAVFFSGKAIKKSADQTYPFVVNRNFYYLTGIDQENVILVLLKGKSDVGEAIFIEETDPIKALWDGEGLSFADVKKISSITDVKNRETFDAFISSTFEASRKSSYGEIKNVYFDLEKRNINDDKQLSDIFLDKIKNAYPYITVKDLFFDLGRLRMIKDELEVSEMKKAIVITNEAINALYTNAKEGLKEYQLEAYYNFVLQQNNVITSFDTIAASGKNATILHYVDNDAIIKNNDLILFDLGVSYNNYCSDISRTFPISGKFTDRQKLIYEIVLEANKKTIEWMKPGHTFKEFHEFGRSILIKGAKKIGLIKNDEEISKYYYHGLGHFLGLDVHDVGDYTKEIQEGMVITVEPGLYIAEESIGIRIEDNILITKTGAVNLSKELIKEVSDIESYMQKNNRHLNSKK